MCNIKEKDSEMLCDTFDKNVEFYNTLIKTCTENRIEHIIKTFQAFRSAKKREIKSFKQDLKSFFTVRILFKINRINPRRTRQEY